MKKISDGIYTHRGRTIVEDEQGICIVWKINPLNIYATLEDAKQAINKYTDGTNTKEPHIIGVWKE